MMEGFAFAKLASAIGIKGFVAIGLAVALGVVMWRADAISGQRDAWQQKAINSDLKLAISNQSIVDLKASLAKFVGAGEASQIAQLASIKAQAGRNADLQAQADAIAAEIASLKSSGKCKTPSSITNSKGL